MSRARNITHELTIAARLVARGLRRRLTGEIAPTVRDREFRATLEPWLAELPPGLVAGHAFLRVPAIQPWLDTGLNLEPGDWVTWLAAGRVYLSRALDVWVDPSLRLWCRIGTEVPIFRGARATHTFAAPGHGRLSVASRVPGEWLDLRQVQANVEANEKLDP